MTEEQWLKLTDVEEFLRPLYDYTVCAHDETLEWIRPFLSRSSSRKLRLFSVGYCRWLERVGLMNASIMHAIDAVEHDIDVGNKASRKRMQRVRKSLITGESLTSSRYRPIVCALTGSNAVRMSFGTLCYCRNLFQEGSDLDRNARDAQVRLLCDIFGNPFSSVSFQSSWRSPKAVTLAENMYRSGDFGGLPNLAYLLEESGCNDPILLNHCQESHVFHIRGCWVVDAVLGYV